MRNVPLPAAVLGLAGLFPFAYGLALLFSADGTWPTFGVFASTPAGGVAMLEAFGAIILGFMGGCLWGFASAREGGPTYGLLAAASVPAALAFGALGPHPALSCVLLAFGFVVLQGIDIWYARLGLVPGYWLSLRLPLTGAVVLCLLVGALYG